jgi:hypothetical protein
MLKLSMQFLHERNVSPSRPFGRGERLADARRGRTRSKVQSAYLRIIAPCFKCWSSYSPEGAPIVHARFNPSRAKSQNYMLSFLIIYFTPFRGWNSRAYMLECAYSWKSCTHNFTCRASSQRVRPYHAL